MNYSIPNVINLKFSKVLKLSNPKISRLERFEISELGRPVNVTVVESKPRGYFEKSARKALKKWKFDPKRVENDRHSQEVTLAFQLEKEA